MEGEGKSATEIIVLLFAGGVGTGVLVLPMAMASVGYMTMLGLLAFGSVLSAATTWMLFMGVTHLRARRFGGTGYSLLLFGGFQNSPNGDAMPSLKPTHWDGPSYGELLTAATFPSMSIVLDVMLLLYSGGAMVTYYLFLSGFLRLLPFWPQCLGHNETIIVLAAITYPATLLPSIGKLAKLSNVVVAVLFIMTFSIWFKAPSAASARTSDNSIEAVQDWDKSIAAFCTCIYAFVWHNNCVIVAREIRNPTRVRCAGIAFGATSLLCVVYFLIAFGGYWSFGNTLQGKSSIMDMYERDDPLFILLRLALTSSLLVAIDLNIFPMRESCCGLVKKAIPGYEKSGFAHAAWSLFLISAAAVTAILFPGVTNVITFMGGVFGPFMCIIFPMLISRMFLKKGTWLLALFTFVPVSLLMNLAGLGLIGRPLS